MSQRHQRCEYVRRILCGLSLCVGVTALSPVADAQVARQSYGIPIDQLTPVDQRIGDVGPLSTSQREISPGLAAPSGFDTVYRVPGRNDLLMRIDGGVVAVFPQSQYVRTENGVTTVIPPNTMFYIGLPQTEDLAQFSGTPAGSTDASLIAQPQNTTKPRDSHVYDIQPDLPPGSRAGSITRAVVDRSPRQFITEQNRVQPAELVDTKVESDAGPAIVSDENYRSSRVRDLLKRAAQSRAEAHR